MGASPSEVAEADEDEVKNNLGSVMNLLRNKLHAMRLEIKAERGSSGDANTSAVSGGRTIQQISVIRCAAGTHVDSEISNAMDHFFDAAQGAVAGKDDKTTGASAVEGAKSLVKAGLSALFGVKNGQSMERSSFVCLYLNNAFVRVDYKAYSYNASGKKWGAESTECGACYVADLSVLDMATMSAGEIDFLVSQAFAFRGPAGIDSLQAFKLMLVQNGILSRMILKEGLTFAELDGVASKLVQNRRDLEGITKDLDQQASQQAFQRAVGQYQFYSDEFERLNEYQGEGMVAFDADDGKDADKSRERFEMALRVFEAALAIYRDFGSAEDTKELVKDLMTARVSADGPAPEPAGKVAAAEKRATDSQSEWSAAQARTAGPDFDKQKFAQLPMNKRFGLLKFQWKNLQSALKLPP